MSTSDQPLRLFTGVDVGAGRLNAALLQRRGRSLAFGGVHRGDVADVVRFCRGSVRVGVDAPGGLSVGAHSDDRSVAPKFRAGRCSEVPVAGSPPVPWVTPQTLESSPGWMRHGFEVWDRLTMAGLDVVETFPAACFHRLNGGRWPLPKTKPGGRAARLGLLASRIEGLDPTGLGHDDIDAVACALVAATGRPGPHVCERPDGSEMWLLLDERR